MSRSIITRVPVRGATPRAHTPSCASHQADTSVFLTDSPLPRAVCVCDVGQIPIGDLPAFYAREMEFRWTQVRVFSPDGRTVDPHAINGEGMLCAAYSDAEYRADRLGGDASLYFDAFGRWGIERIWRDDLRPCRAYLRHVVLAAAGMDRHFGSAHKNGTRIEWRREHEETSQTDAVDSASLVASSRLIVGPNFVSLCSGSILDSFLDFTFLGDRSTSIRSYLTSPIGSTIMCDEPPESLRARYSGWGEEEEEEDRQ